MTSYTDTQYWECCQSDYISAKGTPSISLHNFPRKDKEPYRYKAWKMRINRKNFSPNHNHVVCNVHFTEEDFEHRYIKELLPNQKIKRRLKKTAIPSLLLCGIEADKNSLAGGGSSKIKIRSSKYIRKKIIREVQDEVEREEINKTLNNSEMEVDLATEERKFDDIGVQCELGSETFYKYSYLFESEGSDESVHFSDLLTDDDSSDSEYDKPRHQQESEAQESSDGEDQATKGGKVNFEYVIVEIKTLKNLFKFCNICNSLVAETKQICKGPVLYVRYKCQAGHCNKWASCENPPKFLVRLCGALLINDRVGYLEQKGVYKLSCGTCDNNYIGSTLRNFNTRINEHLRAIRLNKQNNSNFAKHILDLNHDFKIDSNFEAVHVCNNNVIIHNLEKIYIIKELLSKDKIINVQLDFPHIDFIKSFSFNELGN
ncbi:hypothetical protein FQR65_LT19837 [Abscondita terminalis]|nr:hypothetical protein FQR65_LT19837 [Abscondita terminalis]